MEMGDDVEVDVEGPPYSVDAIELSIEDHEVDGVGLSW